MPECLICSSEDINCYKCINCSVSACVNCWYKWKIDKRACFQCKKDIEIIDDTINNNDTQSIKICFEKINITDKKHYTKITQEMVNIFKISLLENQENRPANIYYKCDHCRAKYYKKGHMVNHLIYKHQNLT